jgi:hypothetical protein
MKASLFTAAGLLVWALSWLANGQTEEGNVTYLGALWVDGGWLIFLLGCLVTLAGLALALLSTVWRSVARA